MIRKHMSGSVTMVKVVRSWYERVFLHVSDKIEGERESETQRGRDMTDGAGDTSRDYSLVLRRSRLEWR